MAGIIISCCLAALVSAGLIAFIYKSFSKSSGDVKTNKEDDKTVTKEKEQSKEKSNEKENSQDKMVIGKVDSKTYEENMKKDLSPEINSAIDYLADLKGFGSKEDMMTAFKNFKNADENTRNAYIKGIDGAINAQNIFIKQGQECESLILKERVPLYQERLTNLNSLKQYLLNNK